MSHKLCSVIAPVVIFLEVSVSLSPPASAQPESTSAGPPGSGRGNTASLQAVDCGGSGAGAPERLF